MIQIARIVNIAFNVQTDNASKNLNTIQQALKEVRKTVEEINKTKLDLGVDARSFNALSKATEKVAGSIDKLKVSAKELNSAFDIDGNGLLKTKVILDTINTTLKKTPNVNDNLGVNKRTIDSYVQLHMVVNMLRGGFREFMKLEDATYNLGVVAQMTDSQIQGLRQTMIDMSTDSTASATEIAKAMDTVMRAGQTYEMAQKIVAETTKLATASGEDLGSAINIVNKIFVALKINTGQVADAVQNLHATATFTATDLEGLGQSAKQYIGALGTLSVTTNKNGKELDTYKLRLMEMGNAFSGILANMGRVSLPRT